MVTTSQKAMHTQHVVLNVLLVCSHTFIHEERPGNIISLGVEGVNKKNIVNILQHGVVACFP